MAKSPTISTRRGRRKKKLPPTVDRADGDVDEGTDGDLVGVTTP